MRRIDLFNPEHPLEQYWGTYRGFSNVDSIYEERDRIRREHGYPTGGGFIGADAPLGARNIYNQKRGFERLAAIATAEGSAIREDWVDLVDVTLSVEANEQALLDAGGQLPADERLERDVDDVKDALERQERRDYNLLIDLCAELTASDQHGMGPDILGRALEGDLDSISPITIETRDGLTREFSAQRITEFINSVAENMGVDVVESAIADCRDMMDVSLEEQYDAPELVDEVLDAVESLVGRRPTDLENAFEMLETLEQDIREDERQEIISRMQLAFAASFTDIDDVIDTLQDRLERARGVAMDEGSVLIEKRPNEPPQIVVEGPDVFDDYEPEIIARAQEHFPLADLSFQDFERVEVGRLTAVAGNLTDVDFSIGEERLDIDDDPPTDDTPPVVGPDAPTETDPDESVAEQFAQDVIREL